MIVKSYCDKYGVSTNISDLFSLYPEKAGVAKTPLGWPDIWPYTGNPGVYVFLDENGSVIYVGKASMGNNIGYRLGGYFKYVKYPEDKRCKFKYDHWSKTPFYVVIVAVSNERAYEAASLEEYLINQLQPTDNHLGKSKQMLTDR